ncbi:MAG: TVP38/TMEM64 family protein [Lentisphaeraceae bacterium]|nr:TVP38/TMEM64 family protein [Lentisphaeraceae bacterium]
MSVVLPVLGVAFLLLFVRDFAEYLKVEEQWAICIYILFAILFVGTSLLPTHVLALTGGWVFGFAEGLAYSFTGIVCASILGYFLSAALSCDKFEGNLLRSEKTKAIVDVLQQGERNSICLIVSLMRLSPVIPFALTNVLLASLKVRFSYFLMGTVVGMLPRTAIMVMAGASLTELDFSSKSGYWSLAVGIVFTVILLLYIGRFARRALKVKAS